MIRGFDPRKRKSDSTGSDRIWIGFNGFGSDFGSNRILHYNGAVVAFDTKKTQHIIDEWYSCALNKDCIAPVGSNRSNHRQDQAILTYLTAREGRYCEVEKEKIWAHL
jgi:hypothetical protein